MDRTNDKTAGRPAAAGALAGPKPIGAKPPASPPPAAASDVVPAKGKAAPKEIGGPPGPEPTRYGDWESKGRCIDF
jgi:hypothetical protein